MDAVRATRTTALCAVALAVARVPWFEARQARPAQGAEAADLHRAMLYHWGLRDHLGWTWFEQMARDGFKPPLWYGGVPLLSAGSPTMTSSTVAAVNAAALLLLAIAAWQLARAASSGDRFAGPLAAVLVVVLPGVLGRITVPGVEATHAALLLLWLLVLRRLREPGAWWPLAAGAVFGAGLLAKWTFAAYALGPWVWEAVCAVRSDARGERIGRLLGAGVFGAALFSGWLLGPADPGAIIAAASDEPTFQGDAWGAAAFYPRELARTFGLGGGFVVLVALCRTWGTRGEWKAMPADVVLCAVAAVAVIGPHLFIPHREARYLLPALAPLAVLLSLPLAGLAAKRPALAVAIVAAPLVSLIAPIVLSSPPEYGVQELRLIPDSDHHGLDPLLRHPSFGARPRNVVTFSIPTQAVAPILTCLHWALYERNASPVLSRGNFVDLTLPEAAFDLERSTHVVIARLIDDQERAALASMGFEPAVIVSPTLPGFPEMALWALEPSLTPPKRGPGPAPPP